MTGAPHPWRRRSPWLLAGGGAAAVVIVLVLTAGPDTSTPEGVVEAVATALDDNDVDALLPLACDRTDLREAFAELSVGIEPSVRVQSAEAEEVAGGESETGAMGTVEVSYTDGTTRIPFVFLDKANDGWCVSKLVHA